MLYSSNQNNTVSQPYFSKKKKKIFKYYKTVYGELKTLKGAGGQPGEHLVREAGVGRGARPALSEEPGPRGPAQLRSHSRDTRGTAGGRTGAKVMLSLMNFSRDSERFPNNYGKPFKCIRRIKRHQLQVRWRRNVKGRQSSHRIQGEVRETRGRTRLQGNVAGQAV